MQPEPITFWDQLIAIFGAMALWLGGETGRVLIASGAGGLVRWFAMEKRRIRTGIMSIIGGAICGFYLWPLVLRAPMLWGWEKVEAAPELFLSGATASWETNKGSGSGLTLTGAALTTAPSVPT